MFDFGDPDSPLVCMKGQNMRCLTTLRAAGIAALLATGSTGLALAADVLAPPPPPPMLAPPPALDAGGGFYLRGDIGMGLYNPKDVHLQPPIAGTRTLSSSLDSMAFIGIGAGYQFNSFLRGDVTGEYRFGSKFRIFEETAGAPPGYNITRGTFSNAVVLANGYVDLGTWSRMTPYVGGGVGMAAVMTSKVADVGYGAFAGGSGSASDRTKYNFAWAIHAGVTYDLTTNIKADVGYRYLNLGTVNSSNIVCTVPCGAPFYAQIKRLDSHDLRVGLRYVFADMAPIYAPGPLIRKY